MDTFNAALQHGSLCVSVEYQIIEYDKILLTAKLRAGEETDSEVQINNNPMYLSCDRLTNDWLTSELSVRQEQRWNVRE